MSIDTRHSIRSTQPAPLINGAAVARRSRRLTHVGNEARPAPRKQAPREADKPGSLQSAVRLESWALIATITVLSDMSTAPTAGESTKPHGSSTPAARGMAMML